jgi:hypothetical protein
MTMWESIEPGEEDVSDILGSDPQKKRHRLRRRAWRDQGVTFGCSPNGRP